jgi:hypothetical protein
MLGDDISKDNGEGTKQEVKEDWLRRKDLEREECVSFCTPEVR